MLFDGKSLTNNSLHYSDVCILGGGVAGIVLAKELKKKFANIAIIESGGEQYNQEIQNLYKAHSKPENFPDPLYSRLRFLGGSSNHWQNNTSPLSPIDFEERSWIPNSGWPINYDEIAPYYKAAADYCGVEIYGDYNTDYWASKLSYKDVFKDSSIVQSSIKLAASPPTRFFFKYGEELKKNDRVTIYKNSTVVDLSFDENKRQVDSVVFQTAPGKNHTMHSKIFVMCFGGIENARMLLIFNRKYNDKLGNQYDNVGRYFMEHPTPRAAHFYAFDKSKFPFYLHNGMENGVSVSAFIDLKEDVLRDRQLTNIRMPLVPNSRYILSHGISSMHILSESLEKGELPDDIGLHMLNLIEDIDLIYEAYSKKLFDIDLSESAQKFGGYQIIAMMEQTPDRENRILLSDSKDVFGLNSLIVDWRLTEEDKERTWRSLEVVAQEIGAMNLGRFRLLKERSERLWGNQLGFSQHHMGTTRMSNSPVKGVTDSNQKVFGVNNLFVGGSSVFPTGGHVPPTLTIAALSIRLAKYIHKEYKYG